MEISKGDLLKLCGICYLLGFFTYFLLDQLIW